ncbi:MAG: pentapeptide repeat-containing protein [Deltaproteobacteria bacterium]|nr:pentapeptide repeat-containing protein [Deltaproteobacteria bacterium]
MPQEIPALQKTTTRHENEYLPSDTYSDLNMDHSELVDFSGANSTFINCSFKYAFFERTYFRKATFKGCDFTGARFNNSNFRSAEFIDNCKFEYASFHRTLIPSEQMAKNLPGWINLRSELCMSLRSNYDGLGDHDSSRLFFALEMAADSKHKKEAASATEAYYTKPEFSSKYPARLDYRLASLRHEFSAYTWGHGLKPGRLVAWIALILLIITGLVATIPQEIGASPYDDSVAQMIGTIGSCAFYVSTTFLGLSFTMEPTTARAQFLTIVVGFLGLLSLGLIIASMYRTLSRW